LDIFTSIEMLQDFLLQFGIWTPLVFFLIQTLQIIIAPIPGNITAFVGGALFGTWGGFLLSQSGILLGSMAVFALVKKYGKPFVLKFVKAETVEKYEKIDPRKSAVGIFIIFLFPFFPDDILCFIAGLLPIDYKTFFLIVVFGRSPGTFLTTLMGAGVMDDTPYQFFISIAIYGILLVVLFLYKDKFLNWFHKKHDQRKEHRLEKKKHKDMK
jgi:uncharacterized membrane protein YdjX (TVP38/TMEM64 family)